MFITPKSRQIRLRFRNEEPLKEKATSEKQLSLVAFGRDEATRTPDPYVPNVVRYQLRYIPNAFVSGCKGSDFF